MQGMSSRFDLLYALAMLRDIQVRRHLEVVLLGAVGNRLQLRGRGRG
jgi:hypothetical protein